MVTDAPDPSRERTGATATASPLAGHLPQLDGLRGIAIALVLVHHAFEVGPHEVDGALSRAVYAVGYLGWTGVDLFFVLSGFLITGILVDSRGLAGWLRSFYARRVLRIFPLYYAFIVFALVAGARMGGPAKPGEEWLAAHQWWYWTYLQNWLYMRWGWQESAIATGHTWSLAVEEQFYLAWPLTIAALGGGRVLVRACLAIAVAALGFRIWLWAAGWHPVAPYVATLARVDALAIGAATAVALRSVSAPASAIIRRGALILLAVAAPTLLAGLLLGQRGPWTLTIGLSALAVAAAAAVAVAVIPGGRRAARILTFAPLVRLGQRSYAIYLFHLPLFAWAAGWWKRHASAALGGGIAGQALFLPLAAAACWLLAEVSWRCFESPILSLKRFFPMPRRPAAPGAEPAPPALAIAVNQ